MDAVPPAVGINHRRVAIPGGLSSPEPLLANTAAKPLPAGWRWVKIGEVCEEQTGSRDPRCQPSKPFRYVDITSVDNKTKRIVEPKKLLGKDAPSRARQVIHAGDVILATTRPNLNAVAIVPAELDNEICSTGFCVLRAQNNLDSEFLFAFTQSTEFVQCLSDLVKGALYPGINDKQVRDQIILLPPLPEQRRIAAILLEQMAAVAAARRSAEEQLAAADALPAAYLRTVFNSLAAQAWPKKRIDEVTETRSGSTPARGRKEFFSGAVPWIKTGELHDGLIDDSEEHVTDAALRECSLPLLPAGTLLVAMYGQGQTRGRTGVLRRPATTNQACFAILPHADVFDSTFLQFWFRHNYGRLRQETEGRGGNQPNLNGIFLRGQQIPLPHKTDQLRIAAQLREQMAVVENLRQPLAEQLAAIEMLPAALLRRAFNGEL
ncbi:MAG: restriction endonuclease subunit S [Kiritimatiellaeota bacterium]|nr:restriction endonuclease subunit S [Kiritimatiellota bacterium]